MGLFDWFSKKTPPAPPPQREQESVIPQPAAWGAVGGMTYSSPVLWKFYDGEKNVGGMGPIMRYTVDHDAVRMRSWQMLLESDIVQIGINRYLTWAVGKGLQLRSQPDTNLLESEGIPKEALKKLSKQIESRWKTFANNPMSSFSDMQSFHSIVWDMEKSALMGGDCLVIINIVDGVPKVEIKDGQHVRTPIFNTSISYLNMVNPDNGNRIRHGVEIDDRGEHVAYYVRKSQLEMRSPADYLNYIRVPARDQQGNVRAFLHYGIRYRIDDLRGIPLIACCMETVKQLEMYKESSVQGVVERAKLVFTIEHELQAIGSNPLGEAVTRGLGYPLTSDIQKVSGQSVADTFASTYNRTAINLTPGSKVAAIAPGAEVAFSDFYDTNIAIVFAAIGIPVEVALMKFGSNYSASRAAIKDWEHTLEVRRDNSIALPYQNLYNVFFLCMVLTDKIDAPKYLEAFFKKDYFITNAYTSAKWIGDRVPNIDEKKEADATRVLLGENAAGVPLISVEDAMARHTAGEFDSIITQFADEKNLCESLDIEPASQVNKPQEKEEAGETEKPKPQAKQTKKTKAIYTSQIAKMLRNEN